MVGRRTHVVAGIAVMVVILAAAISLLILHRSPTNVETASHDQAGEDVDIHDPVASHRTRPATPEDWKQDFREDPEWWMREAARRSKQADLPGPCKSFGHVTWEDGVPAPGARIEMLMTRRHGASGVSWEDTGTRTDDDGWYELAELPNCPLRLAASTSDPFPGRAEEMEAPASEEFPRRLRRDLVIQPVCAIAGRVTDMEGVPLQASVHADPSLWLNAKLHGLDAPRDISPDLSGRFWAYEAISSRDGRFEFSGLPDGNWTLMAEADGHRSDLVELAFDSGECPRAAEFILQPNTCWSIQVRDPDGAPIAGATVYVLTIMRSRVGWTGEIVETDADGVAMVCETTPESVWRLR